MARTFNLKLRTEQRRHPMNVLTQNVFSIFNICFQNNTVLFGRNFNHMLQHASYKMPKIYLPCYCTILRRVWLKFFEP